MPHGVAPQGPEELGGSSGLGWSTTRLHGGSSRHSCSDSSLATSRQEVMEAFLSARVLAGDRDEDDEVRPRLGQLSPLMRVEGCSQGV
jgi:hypothetical protein